MSNMQEEAKRERVVMIPVDGSTNSERAFDFYLEKINEKGDKVIVFNAYEIHHPVGFVLPAPGFYDSDPWNRELEVTRQRVQEIREKYLAKCRTVTGLKFEFKIERVPAGEAIVKVAKENDVDLIVLGTRGLGTIRRTIMGSVSDYVLHHSDLPTIIVP